MREGNPDDTESIVTLVIARSHQISFFAVGLGCCSVLQSGIELIHYEF
jgi:hypothetical protein